MVARLEALLRQARRRLSRSEWAIRHLGLTPSEGTAEEPGLLMIQIDGLARSQLERAIAQGRMPFMRGLLRRNGYQVHDFYPGLPSTTPAVQGELFYAVRSAVPAFYFLHREDVELSAMFSPGCAKQREAECATHAEGLLRGGSSWSNIYTGGAGQHESHFCIASNDLADMWRTGKIRNIFLFSLLQLPALLRIFGLLFIEAWNALRAALRGIRHGRRAGPEFSMILSRVFIATGLRELIRIGGRIDVARGLPIVHVNFVGYDEHAHRRGPGSRFALRSLRGIDRAIKGLYREAHKSHRRDYTVWIYSDHGQEHVRSFALEFPGGMERKVREVYESLRRTAPSGAAPTQPTHAQPEGPRAWHRRQRSPTSPSSWRRWGRWDTSTSRKRSTRPSAAASPRCSCTARACPASCGATTSVIVSGSTRAARPASPTTSRRCSKPARPSSARRWRATAHGGSNIPTPAISCCWAGVPVQRRGRSRRRTAPTPAWVPRKRTASPCSRRPRRCQPVRASSSAPRRCGSPRCIISDASRSPPSSRCRRTKRRCGS